MNTSIKTKNIVLGALFASLIFIATLFHIPTGFNGGYIHIGDTFIYLAAVLLPTPYAMLASGIGAALCDGLSGAALWILPTLIIKPLMVLCFKRNQEKIFSKSNIFSVIIAGLLGWFGYYIFGAIISGNFIAPLATFFIEMIQPIISGIIFLVVGYALDKINIKEKILKVESK